VITSSGEPRPSIRFRQAQNLVQRLVSVSNTPVPLHRCTRSKRVCKHGDQSLNALNGVVL
jgi:hypothetical protein